MFTIFSQCNFEPDIFDQKILYAIMIDRRCWGNQKFQSMSNSWLVSQHQANIEQREGVQILMQAVKYIQLRSISHSKLMKVPPSSQHCVVHSYFVKPT